MKLALSLALLCLVVLATASCGKEPGDAASAALSEDQQKHAWFRGEWSGYKPPFGVVIGDDDRVKVSLGNYEAEGTGRYNAKKGIYTTQIAPGKGGTPGKTFYQGKPEDFYIELVFAASTAPGRAPNHLNYRIQSMKYRGTSEEGIIWRKKPLDD